MATDTLPRIALAMDEVPAPKKDLWTATDLLHADFPEPTWVVPHILPEGLTMLGGRAKLGKSWLALQLAQAVAVGGRFFDYPIEPRRVLFLALEDGKRRLKQRMKAQEWPDCDGAFFLTTCKPPDLEKWLDHTGAEVLIVDTFSRFFSLDQSDVQPVTEALGGLQTMAHERNLAAVVLDHHRKGGGGDAIGDLLGSTGKGAVADTVWGLYRDRGKRDATLSVTGRDVEQEDLRLRFDPRFCCWQPVPDEQAGEHDAAVLRVLANGPAGVTALARELDASKGSVHKALTRLVTQGKVYQDVGNRQYALVSERGV